MKHKWISGKVRNIIDSGYHPLGSHTTSLINKALTSEIVELLCASENVCLECGEVDCVCDNQGVVGNRNITAHALLGDYIAEKKSPSEILKLMLKWNKSLAVPLSYEELISIIISRFEHCQCGGDGCQK